MEFCHNQTGIYEGFYHEKRASQSGRIRESKRSKLATIPNKAEMDRDPESTFQQGMAQCLKTHLCLNPRDCRWKYRNIARRVFAIDICTGLGNST